MNTSRQELNLFLIALLAVLTVCLPAYSGSLHRLHSDRGLLLQARGKAVTQNQIPPGFVSLIPEGAEVSSPTFSKTPMMAQVSFYASKKNPATNPPMYKMELRCFETNGPIWGMQESLYRGQMAKNLERKRTEMAKPLSSSGVTYEAPAEKKYPWGTALIQRVVHHFVGVESKRGSDIVSYNTAYFGMVGGVMWELAASNVPDSADEANRWAEKVADKASRTGIGNIAD